MENITGSQEWPYNLWNIFVSTFSKINVEDSSQKYVNALQSIFDNVVAYMNSFFPYDRSSENYFFRLKEHTAFVTWLFGQFVGILFREKCSSHFETCVQTQLTILKLLNQKSLPIYLSVMKRYVEAFKDIVEYEFFSKKHGSFTDKTYKWFVTNPGDIEKCTFSSLEYKISTKRQCSRLVQQMLKVVVQNMEHISYSCKELIPELNNVVLLLLCNPKKDPIVFDLVSEFVYHCGYPTSYKIASSLLRYIFQDIKKYCSSDKVTGEEEFCHMLRVLTDRLDTCNIFSNIMHKHLPQSVLQHTKNEKVRIAVAEFIQSVIYVGDPSKSACVDASNADLNNLSLCKDILIDSIIQSVQDYFERNVTSFNDVPRRLKVADVSELWRNISESFSNRLKDKEEPDHDEMQTVLLQASGVLNIACNVSGCACFREKNLIFFEEQIHSSVTKIMKIAKNLPYDKTVLKMLISVIGNVALLPEVYETETEEQKIIVQTLWCFLGMPWIFTDVTNYFRRGEDRVFPIYKICKSFIDAEIETMCLHYSLLVKVDVYRNWRESQLINKLLDGNKCLILNNLNSFLANSAPANIIALLKSMSSEHSFEVCAQFSQHLSKVACTLSGNGYYKRFSPSDTEFCCKICNKDTIQQMDRLILLQEVDSLPGFISYIQSYCISALNGPHETVACSVVKSVPSLFKHINKAEMLDLIETLEKFLRCDNAVLSGTYIDILPCIIFPCGVTDEVSVMTDLENGLFEASVKELFKKSVESLDNFDSVTQYTAMTAIFKIGCVPLESTLYPCIKILIRFLVQASSYYPTLAKYYIQEIAVAHGLNEDQMYIQYRDDILKIISEILLLNHLTYGSTIEQCLHRFDYRTVFNEVTQDHIVKFLIPYIGKNRQLGSLLKEIAEFTRTSVRKVLMNSFRHIYPYVVLFESAEVVDNVVEIISEEVGLTLPELLSGCYTKVLVQFLTYYDTHKEKVEETIRMMHSLYSSSSPNDIKTCIQPKFLGILMIMENRLTSNHTPHLIRRHILSSLTNIIPLMGTQYITSIRYKILAVLKTTLSLNDPYLIYLSILVWQSFIECLHPDVLGSLLSTVFVSLLPFATQPHYSTIVNNIFRFLLLRDKIAVEDYVNELYFISQTQCDRDVYKAIQSSAVTIMEKPVCERLELILRWLKHEMSEVWLQGIKRLQMELAKYRPEITPYLLTSAEPNLMLQILDALMHGFRDNEYRVQEASAECFGELGAIDPTYIPCTVRKSDLYNKFPYNTSSDEFITEGLTVLCRGFQAAKSSLTMDKFALAIQEFLNLYAISEDTNLWRSILPELQELMSPFRSTTYISPPMDNSDSNIPLPVFGSPYGKTLHSWAFYWSTKLVNILPEEFQLRTVFTRCKGAVSSGDDCLLFFLPHVLLYAIYHATEEDEIKIRQEMLSIFDSPVHSLSQTVARKKKKVIKSNSQIKSKAENCDVKQSVTIMKMMFTFIDLLKKALYDIGCSGDSEKYQKLEGFLNQFPKKILTEKAIDCGDYARALLYIEDFLQYRPSSLEECIPLLSKTYYHLHNTDDMKGILSIESDAPKQPQDVVLLHEITDQFHDATICYQKLLQNSNYADKRIYEKRMLECYLAINQPQVALSFINSFGNLNENDQEMFDNVAAEAMWSLSRFEDLKKLVSERSDSQNNDLYLRPRPTHLSDINWGIQLGRSMIFLLDTNKHGVRKEICSIRQNIAKLLHVSSVSASSYRESYQHFIKLHILNEFEKIAKLVTAVTDEEVVITDEELRNKCISIIGTEFTERLNKLQPFSRVLQPVLNMRQVIFTIAKKILSSCKPHLVPIFEEEIKKCWIKKIEIARQTRNFQLAYSNIIEAQNYELKGFFIEKAKYFWDKGEHSEALRTLKHGLNRYFPDVSIFKYAPMDEHVLDRQLCSEALLLIGIYNDKMANMDMQRNLKHFVDAVEVYKCCEKALLKLADYKDKILNTLSGDKMYKENLEDYIATVNYYGKSLDYGCEFIYQSMSRMISIWLDFSQDYYNDEKSGYSSRNMQERKTACITLRSIIDSFVQHLPVYFFFVAFSQITSRISHPTCYETLKTIIINCISAYPNQSLWKFTSFLQSSSDVHVSRCKDVLNDKSLLDKKIIIESFKNIFVKLTTLCSYQIKRPGKATLSEVMKDSALSKKDGQFNMVMIPVQRFLEVTLPRPEETSFDHNPFPSNIVYIHKFRDEMYVFNSLQKPKRIFLIGTDGKEYSLMCKGEDDLRLDCRFMEFCSIVNTYLKRDTEARDRALHIRTYSVIPLFQKCGVIEFLNNLVTMRAANHKMLQCFGKSVPQRTIREMTEKLAAQKSSEERKSYFLNELLPLFPPVLKDWYKREFPNPGTWYIARCAYVRTVAVMSMVGYVIGLGDRHNDNILMDSSNGDIVHVDFNLLFNEGETLHVPEVVPFRLTRNMVDAMGPVGVEGMYIHSCEITNRILRSQKEQLLSVLNPFLYDPLIKWTYKKKGQKGNTNEKTVTPNQEGRNKIKDIELRLDGVVRTFVKESRLTDPQRRLVGESSNSNSVSLMRNSMPLSIEGQTRRLIEEATDLDNLSVMYHGWGAFM